MLREKIITIMKDFKEVKSCATVNNDLIYFPDIPIEPDLMGYLFKNILSFNVRFHIFEKINYIIYFKYKQYCCCISHKKFSYELSLAPEIKKEVIDIFRLVKIELEKLFLQYAIKAVTDDSYCIENNCNEYRKRLSFFEKEISSHKKIVNGMKNGKLKTTKIIKKSNEDCEETIYINLEKRQIIKIQYLTESYINILFSYIEHVLTLLAAFTNYKITYKNFEKVIKSGWKTKWGLVFEKNEEANELLKQIELIKEIHRNRIQHGMFSKELKIFVSIENFGNYPVFIGKNLRGFTENNKILESLELYKNTLQIKEKFISIINKLFPEKMILINAGIIINLKTEIYKDALINTYNARKFANYVNFMQTNQLNMDW